MISKEFQSRTTWDRIHCMRGRFVSILMIAVMLTLSMGAARAFAGISEKHAAAHMTDMPCPCPDKSDCPSDPCEDISVCVATCLGVFSIEFYATTRIEPQSSTYPDAIAIHVGGIKRPPPLPPPTI